MDQGRLLRPVEKIAGQRVADMRHMHPDLMGAPGLRHELYETAAVKACNEIVVRTAAFPSGRTSCASTEPSFRPIGASIRPQSGEGRPSQMARYSFFIRPFGSQ